MSKEFEELIAERGITDPAMIDVAQHFWNAAISGLNEEFRSEVMKIGMETGKKGYLEAVDMMINVLIETRAKIVEANLSESSK